MVTRRWLDRYSLWLTLGLLCLLAWGWLEIQASPRQLQVGNVYTRSVSVGWISRTPSVGCVWTLWPVRKVCVPNAATTNHLVTVTGLVPGRRVMVIPAQGFLAALTHIRIVRTLEENSIPARPRPAFGSVVSESGVAPGVLVALRLQQLPETVLAITDTNGNWSMDLSRYPDGKQDWIITAYNGSLAATPAQFTWDDGLFPTMKVAK